MGTRGLNGFVIGGEVFAAYNQYDTYPDGLGATSIEFVKTLADPATLEQVKQEVPKLRRVDEQDEPTGAELEALAAEGVIPQNVSSGSDWYATLREAQGTYEGYLKVGIILDSAKFASDSLFCEYGYLVNLDDSVLEFYRGFQSDASQIRGRFAGENPQMERGYGPISLVEAVPFSEIFVTPTNEIVRRWQIASGYDEEYLVEV